MSNKFKVGDRVRQIGDRGPGKKGDEFTVRYAGYELVEEAAPVNSILAKAKDLIEGERAAAYGSFAGNAKQQAALWNAYLSDNKGGIRTIEPMDVPAMMILVKLMRLSGNNTHQDSWVDAAGFAALAEQVHDGAVEPAEDPRVEDPVEESPKRKFKRGDLVTAASGVRIKTADGGSGHHTGGGFTGSVSHYSELDWVSDFTTSPITVPVVYVDRSSDGHRIAVPERWLTEAAPVLESELKPGLRVRVLERQPLEYNGTTHEHLPEAGSVHTLKCRGLSGLPWYRNGVAVEAVWLPGHQIVALDNIFHA